MSTQHQQYDLFAVTEVELIYRNKQKACDRPRIIHSKDAYDILLRTWDMNKIELLEEFKILLLDRANNCIGISHLAKGGISGCVVDLKLAFALAMKARSSSIILAHNHPSGNTAESSEDRSLTKDFVSAGKILKLPVVDHIIVTKEKFKSFADEGMI